MALAVYPDQWWPDVDQSVMSKVSESIQFMTVALYQGRLGQWPALCLVQEEGSTGGKLAWSMAQLIDVVERTLPDLEQKVCQQEALAVARLPASPWSRDSPESGHPWPLPLRPAPRGVPSRPGITNAQRTAAAQNPVYKTHMRRSAAGDSTRSDEL